MDQAVAPLVRRIAAGEIELSVREWCGAGRPFLLVHGLASNAMTWDLVSQRLHTAGHHVVAVDQRGHGRSDKPDRGYDFDAVTADLRALLESLGLQRPIVAGQSWGGNVVLDFAARFPDALSGLVLVDGGIIDLSGTPGASWEKVSVDLRPPDLLGTPRAAMVERFRSSHPGWSNEQIELQMGNYETLEDGSIRPRLTLERHMEILRALWEQDPNAIFEWVDTPALIAIAGSGPEERRRRWLEDAMRIGRSKRSVRVRHFEGADHDIHVDQPDALAGWVLAAVAEGFFG